MTFGVLLLRLPNLTRFSSLKTVVSVFDVFCVARPLLYMDKVLRKMHMCALFPKPEETIM
jgi:hypothetical protein